MERIGPASLPPWAGSVRVIAIFPIFPRLSPATWRAYNGDTQGSHESGVCGSGSLGEKGAMLRVGRGGTGRPIQGRCRPSTPPGGRRAPSGPQLRRTE